ncbi:InlB B-repeat-containing protein [uncultured Ruminococcus sp.]|uniref:InlB B-repeat-containing protein n=1 Tax=uncultured Ruminococcus sp. TaxID=165186 RepID=UPI0025D6C6C9|nr:InlB B-repeat-containing protein [uncultured Ruminococcus sp.]
MKTRRRKLTCFSLAFLFIIMSAFEIIKVFAAASEDVVTGIINYYYYDEQKPDHKGTSPFPSFVANMPKDSPGITQKSPIVPGFSPCNISKEHLPSVTIEFDKDSETDVFYFPAEVDYVIRLYTQELNNDDYSLQEIISNKGVTGSEPEEFGDTFHFSADYNITSLRNKTLDNAFEGFTLMYHVPEVIAADGSTEFECYYDRNYYLVDLDLGDGAYGVEPLYVPYEYPISLGTPVKTGYQFDGWDIKREDTNEALTELPTTMPAYNIHCKAKWKAINNVNYRIVYYNAEVDDGSGVTKYNYWGDKMLSALPDTELSLSSIMSDNKDDITTFTDYQFFTFDPEATAANNSETIKVKSDGSSIIRLYYKRNKYKLRFVYLKYSSTTTITAGAPVTSVTDNHKYVLVNTNNNRSKALTNLDAADNMRALTNFNNNNFNYLWELVPTEGGYYIQYSDGKYLSVDFKTISAGNAAIMSDTPTLFKIAPYGESDNEFLIYTVYKDKNFYLNDKSNKGERVQVYPSDPAIENGKDPNRWQLYDYADANISTNSNAIKVATATGNGNFTSSLTWGGTLNELPAVDTVSGITPGEFVLNNETYKYVELVAEYNANIESLWPADIFQPVNGVLSTNGNNTVFSFGSWSTQAGTKYREKNSTHANIVGRFPYLSSDMIVDPSYVYDPSNPDRIAQSLYAWWGSSGNNISKHRIKIFFETLDPNASGVTEYKGNYYLLDHTVEAVAAHNGNTRIDPFTYSGLTILQSDSSGHINSSATEEGQYQDPDDGVWTTEFHYLRNSYSLSYYNYNTSYSTGADTSSIKYEYPLAGFEPTDEPPYPSGLKPGSYEFAGWYDSDTYDNEFDWTGTMPDHNVMVYAYWKPKTFEILYYNDESAYQNKTPTAVNTIYEGTGDYGQKLDTSAAEEKLEAPEIINSTGTYYAVKAGWYYYDEDGELHAFDPDTMTVSGGMELFMKWSSTVPATFTVHYYVKGKENDAVPEKVAPDMTGYSFVGLTRTFKAKVENELDDDYRLGYFPDRSSTSILMKADSNLNVKSFLYTYRDNVPYKVRYIAKDGVEAGQEIHESKLVSENRKAVVTEKFIHINGYVPSAYYISKTLIVSDNPQEEEEQNVITFYYNVDTKNMPYHIKYMVEDENGKFTQTIDGVEMKFKEKNYIDGYGERSDQENERYKSFVINSYAGYTVKCYQENVFDTSDIESKGELNALSSSDTNIYVRMDAADTANSKVVYIYYLKKSYPVKVIYQVTSNDPEKIKDFNITIDQTGLIGEDSIEIDGITYYKSFYKVIPDRKFNTTYTENAITIEGFSVSGGDVRTRVISDDDAAMTNNRLVFNYTALDEVMFYYYAVIPDGNTHILGDPKNPKLLSYNEETVIIGTRPSNTVEAKIDNGIYKFYGWYSDEECTIPVTPVVGTETVLSGSENNMIRPLASNKDMTYYAKYDYRHGDLKIEVTGDDVIKGSQPYEFIIKGKDGHNNWIELVVCIKPEDKQAVIIKDLPIGDYEITQNKWSWRCNTHDPQVKTVAENNLVTAVFLESIQNKKWLDGNAYNKNIFT